MPRVKSPLEAAEMLMCRQLRVKRERSLMVERRDAVAPLACGFDSRHSRFSGVLGIARGQGAAALLKTLIIALCGLSLLAFPM